MIINTATFTKPKRLVSKLGQSKSLKLLQFYNVCQNHRESLPLAAWFMTWVCDRSLSGIVGSNLAGGMCCDYCVLTARDLCFGLITRPYLSVCVLCVTECDRAASVMKWPWPTRGCWVMWRYHIPFEAAFSITCMDDTCFSFPSFYMHEKVSWESWKVLPSLCFQKSTFDDCTRISQQFTNLSKSP